MDQNVAVNSPVYVFMNLEIRHEDRDTLNA